MIGQFSAVDNLAHYVCIGYRFYHKLYNSVVYENPTAYVYILGKMLKGNGGNLLCSLNIPGGKGELVAAFYKDRLVVLKITQSYFRAFGIKKSGYVQSQLVAESAHHLETLFVNLVVGMREVESGYIHSRFHYLAHNNFIVC